MRYIPKPIDTSEVSIPEELKELLEVLAKNTHEVWAVGRMRAGWKYGEIMDEKLKTHPSLVPYEELPEGEKDFDRNTSIETLKLLLKLGYRIEKL